MHKIGVNINQIAKKVNTTGDLYPEEMQEDVYKRQVRYFSQHLIHNLTQFILNLNFFCLAASVKIIPVSYTHLIEIC